MFISQFWPFFLKMFVYILSYKLVLQVYVSQF